MSLYLPEDLKQRVADAARLHGMSEDDYMREAIERAVAVEGSLDRSASRPRPRLPLFASGDPTLSQRVDEILAEGFGKDGLA